MNKEKLNYNIQLFFFPGICIVGLLISLFSKSVELMPFFYGFSIILRLLLSFSGNIYGKGHWFSRKECFLDSLIFIVLGIIGEIEIITYVNK